MQNFILQCIFIRVFIILHLNSKRISSSSPFGCKAGNPTDRICTQTGNVVWGVWVSLFWTVKWSRSGSANRCFWKCQRVWYSNTCSCFDDERQGFLLCWKGPGRVLCGQHTPSPEVALTSDRRAKTCRSLRCFLGNVPNSSASPAWHSGSAHQHPLADFQRPSGACAFRPAKLPLAPGGSPQHDSPVCSTLPFWRSAQAEVAPMIVLALGWNKKPTWDSWKSRLRLKNTLDHGRNHIR